MSDGTGLLTTITADLDYNNNGNLITTTKGGDADTEISSYKYNELNQMTEYTSKDSIITSYSYNGNGLRKTKTSSGTTTGFYYQGPNVINETENGILRARNIRGINIIAREDNGGTKAYYIYNGHGDVVNLVTDTGAILNTYDYDAYGKEKIATEGTIKNPYRYAGEYYDEESKLYYLRARYYDPNIARFITEDSYKGDVTYPLSLNLYTYSWNNPIKYVDPSGHDPITIIQKSMELLQIAVQEAQMLIYQYGPEISYGIQQGGQYVIEYGSEIVNTAKNKVGEGIRYLKDKMSGSINSDIDLSKYGKGTGKAAGSLTKIDDYVDLTDFRREHILNRHRAGMGKPGKTEFPASWSDKRILHQVSDVAIDPNSTWGVGKWDSPYATGVRDGIKIRVDFYPESHPKHAGKISTAYPINVPINPMK